MKLKTDHKKKFGKTTNTWRINNMLLNNKWVDQEMKQEIKKTMHGDKTQQSKFGDAAKAVLRGKFIEIQTYFKMQKISQNLK